MLLLCYVFFFNLFSPQQQNFTVLNDAKHPHSMMLPYFRLFSLVRLLFFNWLCMIGLWLYSNWLEFDCILEVPWDDIFKKFYLIHFSNLDYFLLNFLNRFPQKRRQIKKANTFASHCIPHTIKILLSYIQHTWSKIFCQMLLSGKCVWVVCVVSVMSRSCSMADQPNIFIHCLS